MDCIGRKAVSLIPMTHPHVFVTQATLRAHRDWILRRETERFAHLTQWLASRSGRLREPPDWKAQKLSGRSWIGDFRAMMRTGWEAEARLRGMAWAHLITGDPKWLDRAVADCETVLAWDIRGASGSEMFSRAVATGLAMAYDWIYHSITPVLREQIGRNVEARFDAMRAYWMPARDGAIGPHGWTVLGLRGQAGIAFVHDFSWGAVWVREAYDAFTRHYPKQCFPDGGIGCGVGYWVPWLAWPFQVALWSVTGVDIMARSDYYKNAFWFLLYQMNPRGIGMNFGDANIGGFHLSFAETAEFLGRKYDIPEAFWWADWMRQRRQARVDAHGRDRSFFEFYHLLWCGPATGLVARRRRPASPVARAMPTRVFPDSGYVFGHTTWDDCDVEWGVHYGKHMPHTHADIHGLVVHANGVPLLVDSGYYDYFGSPHHQSYARQTVAHNTLLVDHNPQSQILKLGEGGRLIHFRRRKSSVVLVVETAGSRLYGGAIKRFTRSLIFIPPNLFVVADEVLPAGHRHLSFLFHFIAPAQIRERSALLAARYGGRSARGRLDFLCPADIALSQHRAFSRNDVRLPRADVAGQWALAVDVGKSGGRRIFIWTLRLHGFNSEAVPVTIKQSGNDVFRILLGNVGAVKLLRRPEDGRLTFRRLKSVCNQ